MSTLLDEFGDDPVQHIEMTDRTELGRTQGTLSEPSADPEHPEAIGDRIDTALFVEGSSRDLGIV